MIIIIMITPFIFLLYFITKKAIDWYNKLVSWEKELKLKSPVGFLSKKMFGVKITRSTDISKVVEAAENENTYEKKKKDETQKSIPRKNSPRA